MLRLTTAGKSRVEAALDLFLSEYIYRYSAVVFNSLSGTANYIPLSDRVHIGKNNSVRVLTHELGHAIGGMLDEYVSSRTPQSQAAPNIIKIEESGPFSIEASEIPWGVWIDTQTPLPTDRFPSMCWDFPSDLGIGLYEGGNYASQFYYRPSCNSIMRHGSEFDAVGREAMIAAFMKKSSKLISLSPKNGRGFYCAEDGEIEFKVVMLPQDDLCYRFEWEVNGEVAQESCGFESTFILERSVEYGWLPTRIVLGVYIEPDSNEDLKNDTYFETSIFQHNQNTLWWNVNPAPNWWAYYSVTKHNTEPSDNSPANIGQLKHFAVNAREHLNSRISSGGSGQAIENLVSDLLEPSSVSNPQNYAPVNLGQLKAMAKPFYDRLNAKGYNTNQMLKQRGYPSDYAYSTPWNPNTPVSENYHIATLGQLKQVFSFNLDDHRTLSPAAVLSQSGSPALSFDAGDDEVSMTIALNQSLGLSFPAPNMLRLVQGSNTFVAHRSIEETTLRWRYFFFTEGIVNGSATIHLDTNHGSNSWGQLLYNSNSWSTTITINQ